MWGEMAYSTALDSVFKELILFNQLKSEEKQNSTSFLWIG